MTTLEAITNRWKPVSTGTLPITIPGVHRRDLANLFRKVGFTLGAEIGVMSGWHAKMICRRVPKLKLYCIDPWASTPGYPSWDDDLHERHYKDAVTRLAPYDCCLMRLVSQVAVRHFADGSLDFVYIDGDHRYQAVVADIASWLPKVRSGGIIAGHDYHRFAKKYTQYNSHVVDAVGGWTRAYFVDPWFVLTGEKAGTWFWVKP
jgi:hypothetical protein